MICDKCLHKNVCGDKQRYKNIVGCIDFKRDDVFDKIRAEINENIEAYRMSKWESNDLFADGLQMALNIIDRCSKGE